MKRAKSSETSLVNITHRSCKTQKPSNITGIAVKLEDKADSVFLSARKLHKLVPAAFFSHVVNKLIT
jgi:hypothetical protein